DDRRKLRGALLEQLTQVEEHVGTLRETRRTPGWGCGLRRRDRLFGAGYGRKRNLVLLVARRRVVDDRVLLCLVNLFTSDDVWNACHDSPSGVFSHYVQGRIPQCFLAFQLLMAVSARSASGTSHESRHFV